MVVGVGKKTRTFSLDSDLADQLQRRDELNASAVVNKMLREYLNGGESPDVALMERLKRVNEDIDDAEDKRDRLDAKIEELKEKRDGIKQQLGTRDEHQAEQIETVAQMVENSEIPEDRLEPTATVIQHRAGKAQMCPEQFVSEVESEL